MAGDAMTTVTPPNESPGAAARAQTKRREYDLAFNRRYSPPPPPPPPPPPLPPGQPAELVPIIWDGLELQAWENGGEFLAVVTLVTGWYGSPPLNGNNVERSLSDGSVWGRKLLGAREVTIEGCAIGPRPRLMEWRDLLVSRATDRFPRELIIGDWQLGTSLSAMVRADTDLFSHEFFAGPRAWRYSVTVTAADPLLYDREWQQVILTTRTAADAGRRYEPLGQWPRRYDAPGPWTGAAHGWAYGEPYPAGSSAYLRNAGNADAPVYATYLGDLAQSTLTADASIFLAPIDTGAQINLATATLVAEAPGGAPRASYVLPGSRPLVIPKRSTARWHLYSQGSGSVILSWRSAWT